MPAGRPTKYNDDMPQSLIDFFDRDMHRVEIEEVASQGQAVTVQKIKPNWFPTFERWCAEQSITQKTMLNWTTQHPEFLQAYGIAKQKQKDFLLQHGLSGAYNSGFAKFVAINCTDMVDKKEEHVSQDIKVVIDRDDDDL